jgi:hypothetical protein
VSENSVPRRIFEPKREVGKYCMTRRGLYSSPSIIRTIKPRRTRWVGYVTCIRIRRMVI